MGYWSIDGQCRKSSKYLFDNNEEPRRPPTIETPNSPLIPCQRQFAGLHPATFSRRGRRHREHGRLQTATAPTRRLPSAQTSIFPLLYARADLQFCMGARDAAKQPCWPNIGADSPQLFASHHHGQLKKWVKDWSLPIILQEQKTTTALGLSAPWTLASGTSGHQIPRSDRAKDLKVCPAEPKARGVPTRCRSAQTDY